MRKHPRQFDAAFVYTYAESGRQRIPIGHGVHDACAIQGVRNDAHLVIAIAWLPRYPSSGGKAKAPPPRRTVRYAACTAGGVSWLASLMLGQVREVRGRIK